MALLEFENVSYTCNNNNILKNLSLSIESKDFISVVGPSGSGKSTFLKLCCHLLSPTSGRILYSDQDFLQYNPIELREKIAYCFQTPCLFGDIVEENISFPYAIRKLDTNFERVNELFSRFNLNMDFLKKEVKTLSGGEKQRIALIRTLLFKSEVLLLDEVTSSLDVENTLIVEDVVKSLNDEGVTILWITHNPEQSKKYVNKVLTIDSGEIKGLETNYMKSIAKD